MMTPSTMPNRIHFEFKPNKALEAILYISSKLYSGDAGFHKISKIFYFADKMHLQRYGRLICGDHYVAMEHGPVPSNTYDIMKKVVAYNSTLKDLDFESFSNDGKKVVPSREANMGLLSESDIECLNESIEFCGEKDFDTLTIISHDKAWESADVNDSISLESIIATLQDPEILLEHLIENGA